MLFIINDLKYIIFNILLQQFYYYVIVVLYDLIKFFVIALTKILCNTSIIMTDVTYY